MGGNRYLQAFMKSKERALQQSDNEDKKPKDASELFEMTISKATPADILSEYTWFLKNMPQLIEPAKTELIENVKTILDICHFFYTGKICWLKILHPKARILRKIAFRDKIA